MATLLDYSVDATPPDRIVWSRRPDCVMVVLPPPPLWQRVAGLAVGFACAAAGVVASVGCTVFALTRRSVDIGLVVKAPLAAPVMGLIAAFYGRELRALTRVGRRPTVITASPAGLVVTTAREGPTGRFEFPAERICGFGVFGWAWTVTGKRSVRMVVRLTPAGRRAAEEVVILEFVTTEAGVPERLDGFLREGLGLPSPMPLRWWHCFLTARGLGGASVSAHKKI